ncbi:ribose transport system substrate-binding protein [Aequitasia blattaphilus]|uniref:Sugar ABC transporter substrate-binding protein n=1 Tax=Aequitasia blattaphilus TaxID=2949332 RepID=A0ABT1EB30_9FIRM|nr:sugar ABC transporter substrate-binding protein [Aequitasia blattaphilus]MCP1103023.1 sugar ABC transporter substrate-binding protein [Aequitasia blattaphilus]MCR8615663.1 sugar ABC transporter substrate-binding protein [Aequitasia blattaphilus]
MRKNAKKIISSILLTALMCVIFTGCSMDSGKSEPAEKSEKKESSGDGNLQIAYSLHDLSNTYFVTLADGFSEKAKEEGMDVTIQDCKMDVATQIATIENFISQKKDAIFITPVDEKALEGVVKKATDAGIPVISMNLEIPGRTAFITPNEYAFGEAGGKIAGEWIKENLEKEEDAKVVLFTAPEQPSLAERIRGLKEGCLNIAPKAEVVAEQGAITTEAGMSAAETILQAHPDANVIVCNNDASALGAYEAFKAANKTNVCIVGLDATPEAINKIKEGGNYVGTVDIDPYGTGALAIETLQKIIKDGPIEDPVYVNLIPVTSENISDY